MTVKTVCLNMIVNNEMETLERSLGTIAPYIACWVIGDTGSTDGTQEFIRSFFAARNIPGELHHLSYVNFAQARQEAFDRARASELKYDYLLLMEPDLELMVQNPASSQNLTFSAYKVLKRSGVTYLNNRLLRRSPIDHWQQDIFVSLLNVARLKEALEYSNDAIIAAYTEATEACPARAEALHGAARFCRNKGIYERGYESAARGLHIAYQNDALGVEKWVYEYGLLDELAVNAYWTARYTECVDACDRLLSEGKLPTEQRDRVLKNRNFAVSKICETAAPSSSESEAFMKLLRTAREKEQLARPNDEVISAYMEANAACPTRAEALHGVARFCRNKGIYERGYEFATKGLVTAYPNNALFVEDWIYEYGLLDELAVNAYWTERYKECTDACDRLLSEGKLPTDNRDRVLRNKNSAIAKLTEISDHDKIYKRFLQELDASLIDERLAMSFWRQTCEEIRKDALIGNKFEFLRWPSVSVFSVPESSVAPECYNQLRGSAEWDGRWYNLTRDSMVGTPRNFSRDFGTSPILVQHAYHLLRYETATGKSLLDCDAIFEVGGGYGSFCRLLRNSGFKGLHVIYDLPHISSIQRLYLTLSGFSEASPGEMITQLSNGHRFCLITDDYLDNTLNLFKSNNIRVAFVATWSLSEMPMSARERIFPRFHPVCEQYLITFQHEYINLNNVEYNLNNVEYFETVRLSRPELNWKREDVNPYFYRKIHEYLFV